LTLSPMTFCLIINSSIWCPTVPVAPKMTTAAAHRRGGRQQAMQQWQTAGTTPTLSTSYVEVLQIRNVRSGSEWQRKITHCSSQPCCLPSSSALSLLCCVGERSRLLGVCKRRKVRSVVWPHMVVFMCLLPEAWTALATVHRE
jgi:hypothetical protein